VFHDRSYPKRLAKTRLRTWPLYTREFPSGPGDGRGLIASKIEWLGSTGRTVGQGNVSKNDGAIAVFRFSGHVVRVENRVETVGIRATETRKGIGFRRGVLQNIDSIFCTIRNLYFDRRTTTELLTWTKYARACKYYMTRTCRVLWNRQRLEIRIAYYDRRCVLRFPNFEMYDFS